MILALFIYGAPANAQNVRVTNMNALNGGTWVSGNVVLNDVICVYADTGKKTPYLVTITDDSTITPNAFHLENQTRTLQIPYTVNWGNTPTKKGAKVTYGVAEGITGGNDSSQTCAVGGFTSNITITIDRRDLEAAPGGTYRAEVRVFIEPN